MRPLSPVRLSIILLRIFSLSSPFFSLGFSNIQFFKKKLAILLSLASKACGVLDTNFLFFFVFGVHLEGEKEKTSPDDIDSIARGAFIWVI